MGTIGVLAVMYGIWSWEHSDFAGLYVIGGLIAIASAH